MVKCLTQDFVCWLHNTSKSEKLRLFTVIWSRWTLNTYVKEQKSFYSHWFVSDLVIKIDCFHLNLGSLWYALLNVVQSSLLDHLLSQHTGQASLTATTFSLWREIKFVTEMCKFFLVFEKGYSLCVKPTKADLNLKISLLMVKFSSHKNDS